MSLFGAYGNLIALALRRRSEQRSKLLHLLLVIAALLASIGISLTVPDGQGQAHSGIILRFEQIDSAEPLLRLGRRDNGLSEDLPGLLCICTIPYAKPKVGEDGM